VLPLVVIVVLGSTVLLGTTLGKRYSVAAPVLLLLMGSVLGIVPGLSDVRLAPDVVLLLFLPPILYWESLNTSLREIRANLRVIALFSLALVGATMAAVSYTAQALGVDPRAAWVLGAVLAPTDAAAVAGLARRMPRRTLTVLRAESLVNDGTALVLFGVAVASATGAAGVGALSLTGRFLGSYVGGIAAGLLASGVVILVRRRLEDPLREGALSVVTPFAAFLLADLVHASGVVAVVVAGLVLTYASPYVIRARARVQAFAFWDLSTFLLNGGLFVLVGMQFPRALRAVREGDGSSAVVVALTVTAVVVATRLLWVHGSTFLIRALDRRPAQRLRRVTWRARTAIGWAGFRGAVSLAAALAVPATLGDGQPFPDRDLIVFTTSVVILLTMLVQGTTLPAVVRWAHLPADTDHAEELLLARTTAAEAAMKELDGVADELGVGQDERRGLQAEYEDHARAVGALGPAEEAVARRDLDRRTRLGVLHHKRLAVAALRDANRIDDIVLREVVAAMDLEELRLLGPAPTD